MIPTILILCNTAQQAATNTQSIWEQIAINPVYIIFGFLSAVITIITFILLYKNKILDFILPWQWRKLYRDNINKELRKQHLNNKIYIQPYITVTSPYSTHEPAKTELKDKKLLNDFFLKKIFVKEPEEDNTVFFLFGDSGTGKTAALVHLFIDYIKKYNALTLPFQIRLISLRDFKALNKIKSIPEDKREKYILLLDAMDETPEVKNLTQFDNFIDQLKEAFHDYARVVITCRPQFFPNNQTEEQITNPEIQTETLFVGCKNYYLAPFDDEQIQAYLTNSISFRSNSEYLQKANEIVKKNPFIAIRPLVLTYIEDIVKSEHEINTTLDLYDIIIESILKRDIEKSKKRKNPEEIKEKIQQWWEASSLVAKYMYENNKLNITDSELDKILPPDIEKQFKQRSLLTRYGDEFHFSHKSFYEYFMSHRFFFYPYETKQVYGMDFALQLFDELYNAYCNKQSIRFANFQKTTNYSVAYSLSRTGVGLSKINHFSQSETKYQYALTIFRQLAKDNPDAYLHNVAITLNNLANLHRKTNRLQEAEVEYNEALTICRQLAKAHPDAYLPNVAMALSTLADLHRKNNHHKEAEDEYNEALTICRQLAKAHPDAYLHNLAITLSSLAGLHRQTNHHKEAEEEYNEALTICRQLADKNPDAYLPNLAMTLNNLADLHRKTNHNKEAEEEYNEALTICRQLAKAHPDTYQPYVATTLNNLAILHKNTNRHEEAEAEYNEALTICRQLAKDNPDAYLPNLAITLSSLANLHNDTNRHEEAEAENNEALTICRQLADKNPDDYLPNVAITLYNMAWMYLDRKELAKAENAAQESLEFFRILAEKSHDAFDSWVKRVEKHLENIRKAKEAAE